VVAEQQLPRAREKEFEVQANLELAIKSGKHLTVRPAFFAMLHRMPLIGVAAHTAKVDTWHGRST